MTKALARSGGLLRVGHRIRLISVCAVCVAAAVLAGSASAGSSALTGEVRDKIAVGALTPTAGDVPVSLLVDGKLITFGGIEWAASPVRPQAPLLEPADVVEMGDVIPAVVITSAPRTAGTNALAVGVALSGVYMGTTGDLWVLNRENYSVQFFTPEPGVDWVVTATNLVEGLNRIGVYGRGADDSIVGDGARIWVGERYVSVPAVDILSPDFIAVSNHVEQVPLNGTHNEHVRGDIRYYNAKTWAVGLIATGIVDQGDWSVVVSNLDVGCNPVYVFASNSYGDVTFDLTTITRGDRADAARVVITNTPGYIVSDGPQSVQLSGVHSNLQGVMWWTVQETDTGGFFLPGDAGIWAVTVPVDVGTNTIVVSGRDATGERDSDEVTVRVGSPWFAVPLAITIDNMKPTILPYDADLLSLSAWTDSIYAQTVIWTNTTTGTSGTLDPDANGYWWYGSVSNLVVGYNDIYVIMETTFGGTAYDYLPVIRLPREDLPVVTIVNAPDSVGETNETAFIDGTNNVHVAFSITWSNVMNGVQGSCIRHSETEWAATVAPLVPGENIIYVLAENQLGDRTHDVASVYREPFSDRPAVAWTSDVPDEVAYQVDRIALGGTNNSVVVAPPIWINIDRAETGTVQWADNRWSCLVDLQPGMNVLYVLASNAMGQTASDVLSIYRETSPGRPYVWITSPIPTNALPPGTGFFELSGTNDPVVVGPMRWVNAYDAVTGTFDRAGETWSCRVEPLSDGMNVIYVLAENALGQVESAVASVERLRPGGDPVVAVTNEPPESVSHSVAEVQLSGTNSADIVGALLWENATAETVGNVPVSQDGRWFISVSNLIYGVNNIFVTGMDAYGNEANAVASIYRELPPVTRYVLPFSPAVPPYTNWATAARTVQKALDASSDGDVIMVGEGDYSSGRRFLAGEQTMNRIVIDGPITVRGVGDPDKTIIYGEWDGGLNAVRCASVSGGGQLVGVTLKNGHAESFTSPEDGNGGGVRLRGGLVSQCRVLGNSASNLGGGVSAEGESDVEKSVLAFNQAAGGGGLFLRDGSARSCLVHGNTAELGGGIMATVTGAVDYCSIVDNSGESGSGGVVASEGGLSVMRSILIGNVLAGEPGPEFSGDGIVVSDCLLPYPYPGNIEGVPLFRGGDDYHLVEGSPGIDALQEARRGPDPAATPLPDDLDGVPRPLDGDADGLPLADTGAYEFINPYADTDRDGLLDGWEHQFGLSLVSGEGDDGAAGDPDGDDLDNFGEQGADTDPGDPDSVLRIVGMTRLGDSVRVVVKGGINATRTLVAAPGLAAAGVVWSGTATSPAPTTVTNVLIHTGAIDPSLFYRVRAARP